MSKETVWVCDKCGISGSKLEVPGVVEVRDDRALKESNVYLDLCVDCITELLSLIESFMNPKREYPKKIEKLVPKSGSRIETTIIKKD